MSRIAGLLVATLCAGCMGHGHGVRHGGGNAGAVLSIVADVVEIIAIEEERAQASAPGDAAEAEAEAEAETEADEAAHREAAQALAEAPPTLDRAMITQALAAARPSIDRCARAAPAPIAVSFAVRPAGTVERVTLKDHVAPVTAECITDALSVALFPMTQRGAAFTYHFTL